MKLALVLLGSVLALIAVTSGQLFMRNGLTVFQQDGEFQEQEESVGEFGEVGAAQDFIQAVLDLSNKYRAKHGSPPLTLDAKLNADAQAYAEVEAQTNVQKHSCNPCDQYGENLAYSGSTQDAPTGAKAAEWVVNKWYDEVSLYPFDNPGGGDMHKWGHFTQLVWKSTTKMGIGVAYGTKPSKSGALMKTMYAVARYLPPGNDLDPNAMKENVLPAQ